MEERRIQILDNHTSLFGEVGFEEGDNWSKEVMAWLLGLVISIIGY